jgi:hypothetical protein
LYPVIFQVDVNDPTITEVELAGQFNGFCAGCEPMQNTSGTIWTDTLYLPGGSYNYYFTQSSGTIAENLTDMSCTAFNGVSYLRTLTVIESTEAPLVCWNTCSPCTVGQEEINNHSIQLYPNPSNGNISFSGLGGGQYQVSCFDMMGHLVQRFNVSAENKNVQLKNIEQGIYIIRIDGDQTSQQFNMVICE